MGATQSNHSKVVSIQGSPTEASLPSGQFNVSVSGPMLEKGLQYQGDLQKEIENAYGQGKNEGLATIQQTLSVVAMKTYENIHSQILDIQTKNIEESKVLLESVGHKLKPPVSILKPCRDEESLLISCYEKNKSSPLQCKATLDSFAMCASKSFKQSS